MSIALIESGNDTLAVSWSFDGDYVVEVTVKSSGFSGSSSGHVLAAEFESFRRDLVALERTRKGRASLEAVYEREFEIKIEALDALGHIGVSGRVREYNSSGNGLHINELSFGFEFDPSLLLGFARAFEA